MAYLAQKKFTVIDFKKSIMVGNTVSDMQFARNAGMFTVHVRTTHPDLLLPNDLIDMSFEDLFEFANTLQTIKENSRY